MRSLVLVKHVPDEGSQPPYTADLTLARHVGAGVMSGVDIFAVGEAVRLANDGTCVVATVGPSVAGATLRHALMLGASEAVHVVDDGMVGADVQSTAEVLAAVVRRENPDVVLLGREAGDSRMGIMPSLLAELLNWPILSAVENLRVDGNMLTARRRDDRGVIELQTTLPAVASAAEYANQPASATLRDLRHALTSPIRQLDLRQLGFRKHDSPMSLMKTTAIRATPSSRQPHVVTEGIVDEVVNALAAHGIAGIAAAEEKVSA